MSSSALIVDFPRRRHSAPDGTTARKTVGFSRVSELIFVRHAIEPDRSEMHYSEEEYLAMKVARLQAVRDVHRACSADADARDIAAEGSCELCLVGLENILTPSMF